MVSLIEAEKQGTFQCPAPLLLAVGDLAHALWVGGRETAVDVVGKMPGFWKNVTSALFKKDAVLTTPVFDAQADSRLKGVIVAFGILAIELYNKGNESGGSGSGTPASGSKEPCAEFVGVVERLMSEEKLVLWLSLATKIAASEVEGKDAEGRTLDSGAAALTLLTAIQRLILVSTSLKGNFSPPGGLRKKLVNTAVSNLRNF